MEEEENEAKNKNIEENLEQIKEKLFDIEGVGVLTKSEVDERVNMILKMYDEADDEADAGYKSAGVEDERVKMILETEEYQQNDLEEIKEELFEIRGVGVLTRAEVDERVNIILKMCDEADDEADAGYESAGIKDERVQMILEMEENQQNDLEEIKEELFEIEGVGVLTRAEVDERVNMILKMYGKTDDEADAGYESVGVKIEPEETWKDREWNEEEDVPPDWMDEEFYLSSQMRSGVP